MDALRARSSPGKPSPFRGTWLVTTILIILLVALFLRLGMWQLNRRAERRAANAQIIARMEQPPITVTGEPLDPFETELRRGTVKGTYDYSQEIILRNRTWNEYPGVHVLVPLKIAGSDGSGAATAILVDRGWIPYESASPEQRKAFQDTQGEVEVYGVLRKSMTRPSNVAPADPVPTPGGHVDAWHRVDLPKIRQQLPYPLLDVYLEEDVRPGETPRQFPKQQPEISLDEGSHLIYAIQWFSFAIIAAIGYPFLYRERTKGPRGTKPEQTT
jgi:surfeit locus 1 family protein